MRLSFNDLADRGFHFEDALGWIDKANNTYIVADSALVTTPNTTVPAEFAAYIDPKVIEILTFPLKAREVFTEVTKGDWTTSYATFRVSEITGATEPYSDYSKAGVSGVNDTFIKRQNYVYQTGIQYGDREIALAATAKIDLVSEKQRGASKSIDIDTNKIYLQGIAGMEIYGLLTDPALSSPLTPAATGTGGAITWDTKTTRQRYEDIILLFQGLVKQTQGYVDKDTALKLCMSPELSVDLAAATDFNISVQDMLNKYFRDMRIVTIPQLSNATSGQTMMMIAEEVQGQRTGELAVSDKIRASRIVLDQTSYSQKWSAGCYGTLIYLPFAIAQMRGM